MFEEIAYLMDLQVIKTGRENYARWQRESEQENLQRWVEANKLKFKEDDRGVLHFKS